MCHVVKNILALNIHQNNEMEMSQEYGRKSLHIGPCARKFAISVEHCCRTVRDEEH